jgi:hypothetical protein
VFFHQLKVVAMAEIVYKTLPDSLVCSPEKKYNVPTRLLLLNKVHIVHDDVHSVISNGPFKK